MNIANKIIENTANKAEQNTDAIVDKQGFLICPKCKQRKETELEYPVGSGKKRKFPIACNCVIKEQLEFEQRQARMRFEDRLKKLYECGLSDEAYRKNTFDNDDNRCKELTLLCKKYVENWDKLKEENCGILFYGDTGGGKSFYSCCIANALIQKGVRVLVSRLSDLVRNRVDESIKPLDVKSFDLIVLDDIGVENYTQTAYNIIDDIYRSAIPLIVTTNLTPSMLKSSDDLEKKRILDRVLEMCCITRKVDVTKSRLDIAKKKREKALSILEL